MLLVLGIWPTSTAQSKVANYSYDKYGAAQYEQFSFRVKDNKRAEITYSYGKDPKEIKLQYMGKAQINGDSCFKVQFPNKYVLYVIAKDRVLKVVDADGKYNKTFKWEYEGPVNGIGTFCGVCAADDDEAMELMKRVYFK